MTYVNHRQPNFLSLKFSVTKYKPADIERAGPYITRAA